jgi:hypothetical protein
VRPLIIDDAAKAKAARVLDYAAAHHYRPGRPGQTTPGDDPNFVAHFGTYRAVFTYTQEPRSARVYRHLSISVPGKKYPHQAAAFMIATLFGFTGWDERTIDRAPEGWQIEVNQREHCIVLAQVCGHEHQRRKANIDGIEREMG